MARLEKLRAVTAAVQAAESVKFAQSQVAEQLAADVHPDAIGRGIAEQIGLACRISPSVAARRLSTARAWWFELPDTYRQLTSGELSEPIAEQVVTETRHLDPERRGHVDKQLHATGIATLGFKAATACIRRIAYQADRDGYMQRGRTERKHRRVSIRPAPDTMAMLTAICRWSKASPATPHSAHMLIRQSPAVMGGPGTRSWPTRWWNESPDKPAQPTSTSSYS